MLYGMPTCGKPLPYVGGVTAGWLSPLQYQSDIHVDGAYSYIIRRFTNASGSPATIHVHFGTSSQRLGSPGVDIVPRMYVASTDPCPGDAFLSIPAGNFSMPIGATFGTSVSVHLNSACRVVYGSYENPLTPGASALVVPAGESRWAVLKVFTHLLDLDFMTNPSYGGAFRIYWDIV
jgi:hypothetical protein